MLNKIEKQVMKYFYNRCCNKESCLIRPEDIKISLIPDLEINDTELDRAVNNLIYDGYIDLVVSDNKGLPVYCVSLKSKGQAFLREMENTKKENRYLIIRSIALAVLGVVATWLIKLIFNI
ncbi:MAG: hypothetical protein E7359_03620 [Clostridiales bacterium]|nr:hypothetical protein [Clostridiales bacterium]